jgi:heme exporter protein C
MKLWRWLWLLVTLGVLAEGFRVALFVVPPDSAQGNVQRIFYYHIPSWAGMGLFFAINLGCSLVYLAVRNRNEALAIKADSLAVASAEMGVVFCFIGLVTGSLWGRAVWGIWWTWDARLTSTLVLWLIYVAYLLLRRFAAGPQMRTLAAVMAIFGYLDVPLVYMSTRLVADPASRAGVWRRAGVGDRSKHDAGGVVEPGGLADVGNFCGEPAVCVGISRAEDGAGRGTEVAGVRAGANADGGREIVMGDMGNRHLVLAYAATIAIHLVYLGYVAMKWRAAKSAAN